MTITLRIQTYQNVPLPQPVLRQLDQLGGAIGRAVGNELVLEDPSKYISRVHAKLDFHDGGYYLTDVGSNPSVVNDRPLGGGKPMLLADGDKLVIGEYQLLVNVSLKPVLLPASPLQAIPVVASGLFPGPASDASLDDLLSSASILDVGKDFDFLNFDPLGASLLDAAPADVQSGMDLFEPAKPVSAAAPYRGTLSDHVSPEMHAMPVSGGAVSSHVLPAAPAVQLAPVGSGQMSIPDDYDPLADFLPPRITTAPAPVSPAVEQRMPALATASVPELAPTLLSPLLPPLVPAFVSAVAPSVAPAEQVAPARASSSGPDVGAAIPAPALAAAASDSAVLDALLRGLGLKQLQTQRSALELVELAGAMLRQATNGTMDVLMARAMTKRESRLEMTMMASVANNPLKFFPGAEMALTQMLASSHPGYMAPERAYVNAFDDLKAHELATMAGMRAALAGVLLRFDPAAIEQRLQEPSVLDKMMASKRKAKMWDQMVDLYQQLSNDADEDFQRLFGEKFGAAYEEQIQRLR